MFKQSILIAALTVLAGPALAQQPKLNSETTTIGEVLDSPGAKAVFLKVFPSLGSPAALAQLEAVRSASLEDIAAHIPDKMTPVKMAELNVEFDKLK